MDTTTLINIVTVIMLIWFFYKRFAPIKNLKSYNAQQFRELQQNRNSIVIDVREPHEYKGGYIPGAMNIPLSQLKHRVGDVPKDKDVLLYCRSGMRSKQAARILSKKGISQLGHLQGGMMSWTGKLTK
jgi:rhodanese-related sulfurtransferase